MIYATCDACLRPMKPGGGCTVTHFARPALSALPEDVARLRYADDEGRPCHDCNAGVGSFHHPGCDWERCPLCHGQALGCDCDY